MPVSLSENLKKLMEEKGFSFNQLAKKSGVTASTIKTWAQGSQPRDLNQVRNVAKVLEVGFEYLVFGEETHNFSTLEELLTENIFEGYLKVKVERVIKLQKK